MHLAMIYWYKPSVVFFLPSILSSLCRFCCIFPTGIFILFLPQPSSTLDHSIKENFLLFRISHTTATIKILPSLSQFSKKKYLFFSRKLIQAMRDKNIPLNRPYVKRNASYKVELRFCSRQNGYFLSWQF